MNAGFVGSPTYFLFLAVCLVACVVFLIVRVIYLTTKSSPQGAAAYVPPPAGVMPCPTCNGSGWVQEVRPPPADPPFAQRI